MNIVFPDSPPGIAELALSKACIVVMATQGRDAASTWDSDAGLSARFFELVSAYSDAEPGKDLANVDYSLINSCDMLRAKQRNRRLPA